MLDLYHQWTNVGISLLLPAVVALLTARSAHRGVKGLVLLALSAVTGVGTAWLDATRDGVAFYGGHVGAMILTSWVVAVTTHFGLLKPGEITGSGGVIQRVVPGGIGSTASEHVDFEEKPSWS